MTRALQVVDAADPAGVLLALRAALSGSGPAILAAEGGVADGLPAQVARRVALVVETSGSSGAPKRVALSTNALLASAAASEAALGGPGQWLLALPVHYIAGLNVLVRSIAAQTEPVMLPAGHFDPTAFVAAARTMDADLRFTSVVPVQLARLLELAQDEPAAREVLRRFTRILVGGQAVPAALLEQADALGIAVTRTYGSSETGGGCVYDGTPIGTAEMRIRDGQIELAGPMLAEEYLGDPDRTARHFVVDAGTRWYLTGDSGEIDGGVLRVTGRLDRVIISGGVKVSLDRVEAVLHGMPGLGDAVAVAGESQQWGESAVIVASTAVDEAAVRAALVAAIGPAAAPLRLVVLDAIPRLPSGKPDRPRLQAEHGTPRPQ